MIKGADSKCTTTRRMRQNKTKNPPPPPARHSYGSCGSCEGLWLRLQRLLRLLCVPITKLIIIKQGATPRQRFDSRRSRSDAAKYDYNLLHLHSTKSQSIPRKQERPRMGRQRVASIVVIQIWNPVSGSWNHQPDQRNARKTGA